MIHDSPVIKSSRLLWCYPLDSLPDHSFLLFLATSARAVRMKALEQGGKKKEQMSSAPASSHGGLVAIFFENTPSHLFFIKEGKTKYNAWDINWRDASG